jgi:hypothetical protein
LYCPRSYDLTTSYRGENAVESPFIVLFPI